MIPQKIHGVLKHDRKKKIRIPNDWQETEMGAQIARELIAKFLCARGIGS